MKNPFFSIVMPFYNSDKYIKQAIESCLNQTFSNYELIAVDDGSFDSSRLILDSYLNNKKIKLVAQTNKGVFEARRIGVNNSLGEYIVFLDSDDYLSFNALELLYDVIKTQNPDAILFGHHSVKNDNSVSFLASLEVDKVLVGNRTIIESLYINNKGCPNLWSCCFSKKLFTNPILPSLTWCEDVLECYFALKNAKKLIIMSSKIYNYRINSESVTHNLSSKNYFDKYLALNILFSDISDKYATWLTIVGHNKSTIANNIFGYAIHGALLDDFQLYKKRIKQIRKSPSYLFFVKRYKFLSRKNNFIKYLVNYKLYFLSWLTSKLLYKR